MQFQLTISLDNAEVEEAGVGQALSTYLLNVIQGVENGNAHLGAWRVRDGNGNTIGEYTITDD